MGLAYPFVGAVMTESAPPAPSPAIAGLFAFLPKPLASDIKDKGFGTREETLEEGVDFGFGKDKESGIDRGGNDDDDDDEEEDEKVPLVVEEVEEPA